MKLTGQEAPRNPRWPLKGAFCAWSSVFLCFRVSVSKHEEGDIANVVQTPEVFFHYFCFLSKLQGGHIHVFCEFVYGVNQ